MDRGAESFVGLDVGGTFLKAARLSADGRIERQLHQPIRKETTAAILDQFSAAVKELQSPAVRAVGIGLPGIVDRQGRVRVAPNVPALNGLQVGEEVRGRTGLAAFAENDANVAALAEAHHGAGRGAASVLVVTLGTGVGSGLVLDGRLWTGSGGFAGEIGHIQVDAHGIPCGCSSWGCLETLVGVASWERRARERLASGRTSSLASAREIDPRVVIEAAAAGDALAVELLDESCRALAVGIAAALQLLNVERVVLGGGMSKAGPILVDRVREEVRRRSFPQVFADASICVAELGGDAGVIGAATLGRVQAA